MQSFSTPNVWVYLWFERSEDISWNPWFYVIILNFCLFEFYVVLKNFFWNMQLLHEAAHRNYFSNDSNQADLRVCLIQG